MTYTDDDVINVLKMARDKIKRPNGWTKGTWVKRVPGDGDMYAYCATGAVGSAIKEQYGESRSLRRRAVEKLTKMLRPKDRDMGVEFYNDTHDSGDVITLFERTIETAEKELESGSE